MDNIYLVRRRLQAIIAQQLKSEFETTYQKCIINSEYQFNSTDSGKRSLRKTCMSFLMALKQEKYFELCYQDYLDSNNMTDSIGSLALLNQYDSVYREKSLTNFEKKWKKEPLVMDKWFSLQAISENPNCLEDIKKLLQHEVFDIKNPNRVRSLISVFAAQNHINFHKIDGSGYHFIADQVIQLDKINPQVASRMVKSFSRWKRFSKPRQSLMKKQLQRVLSQPDLSGDVYEIVSKSLDS